MDLFAPVARFDVSEVFAHALLHGERGRDSRAAPGAGEAWAAFLSPFVLAGARGLGIGVEGLSKSSSWRECDAAHE